MPESAPVSSASLSNLPTFSDNSGVDAEAQSRAAELVQRAMYFYWHGGDPQHFEQQLFKGITLKGRFDIVEQCFRDAIRLVPGRMDLRFALASTLVVQDRVEEALRIYAELAALDARGFDAPLLHAAYSRAIGRHAEAASTLNALATRHAERTEQFRAKFERLEAGLQRPLQTKAANADPQLGAA